MTVGDEPIPKIGDALRSFIGEERAGHAAGGGVDDGGGLIHLRHGLGCGLGLGRGLVVRRGLGGLGDRSEGEKQNYAGEFLHHILAIKIKT